MKRYLENILEVEGKFWKEEHMPTYLYREIAFL